MARSTVSSSGGAKDSRSHTFHTEVIMRSLDSAVCRWGARCRQGDASQPVKGGQQRGAPLPVEGELGEGRRPTSGQDPVCKERHCNTQRLVLHQPRLKHIRAAAAEHMKRTSMRCTYSAANSAHSSVSALYRSEPGAGGE